MDTASHVVRLVVRIMADLGLTRAIAGSDHFGL